jgi:hypothetical protein
MSSTGCTTDRRGLNAEIRKLGQSSGELRMIRPLVVAGARTGIVDFRHTYVLWRLWRDSIVRPRETKRDQMKVLRRRWVQQSREYNKIRSWIQQGRDQRKRLPNG